MVLIDKPEFICDECGSCEWKTIKKNNKKIKIQIHRPNCSKHKKKYDHLSSVLVQKVIKD